MNCTGCKQGVHYPCGNYQQKVWLGLGKKKKDSWRCPPCKQKFANKSENGVSRPRIDASNGEIFETLLEMKNMMMVIQAEQKDTKAALDFISDQYDKIDQGQKEIKDYMKYLENQVTTLTLNNKEKDMKIENLQNRLAELEQYTRHKNIEIHGVTEQDKEDVEEIVIRVAQQVGVTITRDDIEASHRIPTKAKGKTKPIVAQLRSRKIRNEIIANRKVTMTNKDILQVATLEKQDADRNVYVNEQLSVYYKNLLWEAKNRGKECKWAYIWSAGGKIWARKDEKSKSFRICSEKDLEKIKK